MPYIWQVMIAKAKRLKLARMREDCNLTQAQLGEKLGVSRQAVTAWERGHQSPSRDQAFLLADILGSGVLDIFAEEARAKASTQEVA